MTILVSFGTRPEYIKVKSIINNLETKVVIVKQHTDLFENIDIKYDYAIDIETISDNRLNDIVISIMKRSDIFKGIDYVMVQGDTTSALAMAISAFNNKVKVIHLEAGLRTYDIYNPYPEESNRQLISRIAHINLCPTSKNYDNLISENIHQKIYITGNTGLDNIDKTGCVYGNTILVTLHRRDNHPIMDKWFKVLAKLATKYTELKFILPIHPNPNVLKHRYILDESNINVINPIQHHELIDIIKQCKFIISDSGGIQEEASYLNKKIIICRNTTERPEVLENHGVLCPLPDQLNDIFEQIYNNYIVDPSTKCPFGDGHSWKLIKDILDSKV